MLRRDEAEVSDGFDELCCAFDRHDWFPEWRIGKLPNLPNVTSGCLIDDQRSICNRDRHNGGWVRSTASKAERDCTVGNLATLVPFDIEKGNARQPDVVVRGTGRFFRFPAWPTNRQPSLCPIRVTPSTQTI